MSAADGMTDRERLAYLRCRASFGPDSPELQAEIAELQARVDARRSFCASGVIENAR